MPTPSKLPIAPKPGVIHGQDVPMPLDAAAAEMGVSTATLKRYVAARSIASIRLGSRRMVRPSAIRSYLEKREVKAL